MPSPTAAKKEVTLPRLTLNGERVYHPAAYDLLRQVLRGDGRVPAYTSPSTPEERRIARDAHDLFLKIANERWDKLEEMADAAFNKALKRLKLKGRSP